MSFQSLHEAWLEELQQMMEQLNQAPRSATAFDLHQQLVQKVMSRCMNYYRAKSFAAKRDVLAVFTSPWSTSLERSLHWVGGWRPTTVFHLIYTEFGIQFESHIVDILNGHLTGDLGDLTTTQLRRVSELQCETVQQENYITELFSDWQDEGTNMIEMMSRDMDAKMDKLVEVLGKADELRMMTMTKVVELLTAQQAVEFLIAAAQLMFGIRRWGIHHDRQRGNA